MASKFFYFALKVLKTEQFGKITAVYAGYSYMKNSVQSSVQSDCEKMGWNGTLFCAIVLS